MCKMYLLLLTCIEIEHICTPNGINFNGILKHNWTGPRILWTSVTIDSAGHPCRSAITKAGCTIIPVKRSPKDRLLTNMA
jgi:hypothetical protein